jgi:hypothetical protein
VGESGPPYNKAELAWAEFTACDVLEVVDGSSTPGEQLDSKVIIPQVLSN